MNSTPNTGARVLRGTLLVLTLIASAMIGATSVLAQSTQTAAVTASTFDSAYWAHQAPAVAALNAMQVDYSNPVSGGRTQTAFALATQGYVIDEPIMIEGWDAYTVMSMRASLGMTWVPSALQQPLGAPNGYAMPGYAPNAGQLAYPSTPPPGAIVVSTSLSAYPPFTPPVTATAAQQTPSSCVGASLGAGYYAAPYYSTVASCTLLNGASYTSDPRGPFVFHITTTPFGNSTWFTPESN